MQIERQIEDTFKDAFNVFRNNYVSLIIGTIIGLLMMIFIITIPPMAFGIYYICSQALAGKKVKGTDVFQGFNYFFTSWGIFIIAIVLIMIGLVLLVIPGLLLMIMFQYVVAIAIMKKQGVIDSLKNSYELAKKNFTYSIVFWVLLGVLGVISSFTRIGVLLTVPFSSLCICVAVKKLK